MEELFDLNIYHYRIQTLFISFPQKKKKNIIYFKLIQYASPHQISQCLIYNHILQICNPD